MTKPARDWERDWELCQRATPGPWYPRATDDERFMNAQYVSTDPGPGWLHDGEQGMSVEECEPEKVIAITLLQTPRLASVEDGKWDENTEFIAEAREALPYWLQRVKELEDALRQCVEALEFCSHKELCKITVGPYDLIDYAKHVLEVERNDVDGNEGTGSTPD